MTRVFKRRAKISAKQIFGDTQGMPTAGRLMSGRIGESLIKLGGD
jgi:hypothetical protein